MIGLIYILGGLALFLFGIRLLSSGMEMLAGDQIQNWLDKVTNHPLKSALFGTVATALIQSSGLLMVTMIGLINANLMTVSQAISVMLGQEIGTTLTAQIVAFDIGPYRLLLVIVGVLIYEFVSHRDWKKYGEILTGLGIIFVGMSYMSQALKLLVDIPWIASSLVTMGEHPLAGVLAGLVLTSITQSSTAVTSIVVAMGISHVITLDGAVGIILGANIGSCITGLVASLNLSHASRQASMAQILINVIGVILFIPFISGYSNLIAHTSTDLARQIANAHTIFNVVVSLLMFPFVKYIARVASWLVPAKAKIEKPKLTMFIDEMQQSVPSVALKEAARELVRLGEVTADMVENSCMALIEKDVSKANAVIVQEDKFVDPVFKTLVDFLNLLMQKDLSIAQQKRCLQMKNLLTDIERVGDMAEDIAQYALERVDNEVPFSAQAVHDLAELSEFADRTYRSALQAFRDDDRELALEVCRQEAEFDQLYWRTRQSHIDRLEAGICDSEANVIFTETLRNLERVSDHADNFGVSVARSFSKKPAGEKQPVPA